MNKANKARGRSSKRKCSGSDRLMASSSLARRLTEDKPEKDTTRKTKAKKAGHDTVSARRLDIVSEKVKTINPKKLQEIKELEKKEFKGFDEFFAAKKELEVLNSNKGGKFASNYDKLSSQSMETLKEVYSNRVVKLPALDLALPDTAATEDDSWQLPSTKQLASTAEHTGAAITSNIGSNRHIEDLSLRSMSTIAKVLASRNLSVVTSTEPQIKQPQKPSVADLPQSLTRLSRALSAPLPPSYSRVQQAFIAMEQSFSILDSHRNRSEASYTELSRLCLSLCNHCICYAELQSIMAAWPECLDVSWKDKDLLIRRLNPYASDDTSLSGPALLEKKKSAMEAKLMELSKVNPQPPRAELPSKPANNQALKSARDFLSSFSEDTYTETLWKRVEEEKKRRQDNLQAKNDENSSGQYELYTPIRRSKMTSEQENSVSVLGGQILEVIRQKEADRKKLEEEKNKSGRLGEFECKEIIDLSNSIMLYYSNRKVSNMFLCQVIDRLTKSSATSRIYSKAEITDRVQFVVDSSKGWLTKVENPNGVLLRLNSKIPLSEVHEEIRSKWSIVIPTAQS